jgi:hypothetical protein
VSYERYRQRVPMIVPGASPRRASEAPTASIPIVMRD